MNVCGIFLFRCVRCRGVAGTVNTGILNYRRPRIWWGAHNRHVWGQQLGHTDGGHVLRPLGHSAAIPAGSNSVNWSHGRFYQHFDFRPLERELWYPCTRQNNILKPLWMICDAISDCRCKNIYFWTRIVYTYIYHVCLLFAVYRKLYGFNVNCTMSIFLKLMTVSYIRDWVLLVMLQYVYSPDYWWYLFFQANEYIFICFK